MTRLTTHAVVELRKKQLANLDRALVFTIPIALHRLIITIAECSRAESRQQVQSRIHSSCAAALTSCPCACRSQHISTGDDTLLCYRQPSMMPQPFCSARGLRVSRDSAGTGMRAALPTQGQMNGLGPDRQRRPSNEQEGCRSTGKASQPRPRSVSTPEPATQWLRAGSAAAAGALCVWPAAAASAAHGQEALSPATSAAHGSGAFEAQLNPGVLIVCLIAAAPVGLQLLSPL